MVQIIFAKNKDSSSTKKCCPLVTRGKFKVINFVCYKVWFLWKRKLIVRRGIWKCSCRLTVSFSVLFFFPLDALKQARKEILEKNTDRTFDFDDGNSDLEWKSWHPYKFLVINSWKTILAFTRRRAKTSPLPPRCTTTAPNNPNSLLLAC